MKILLKIMQTIGWDKMIFVSPFLKKKIEIYFRNCQNRKLVFMLNQDLSSF
ncbi:hypothetical protein HMPREF9392_2226 [Streptococcus sanguinis SK678]|nr:hypothetical protein HMPREF9392_2226 [Streptococcus sanguinis SK678]